jgi:DNA-directed RNA polymerase subunit L
VIQDQDHTLGNCLRYQLLQDSRVRFAGYKKAHPLEEKIEIKVQTNGEIAPPDAII